MNIEDFYMDMYVDSSSYDNLRKIASVADGLKNSGRKVLYTALSKNIVKDVKVSRLKSTVSEFTEYLHGEDNLSDVIVTMSRRYTGTNNLPLLKDEGNFGKRFINEASADRYIFTRLEKYTKFIFPEVDNGILIQQEFEGVKIEPRFFVPIIPMLLVNGSPNGISYGFSQNILARPVNQIIKAVEKYLDDGTIKVPKPGWVGFKGTVRQGDEPQKWTVVGKFKRINTTTLEITEIPINMELKDYVKILDTLEENKVISSYKDFSDKDSFNFRVRVTRKFSEMDDEEILSILKLKDSGKNLYEKYNYMGIDNRIKVCDSVDEIFEDYLNIRLDYYHKRKDFMIEETKRQLRILASKYLFIKAIVEEQIIVNKKSKANIIEQIKNHGKITPDEEGSYDFLLRLPIYSLTEEKLNELLNEIKGKKEELEYHKNVDPKTYWRDDLKKLKDELGIK